MGIRKVLLICAGLALGGLGSARADVSLYDPTSARSLGSEGVSLFGPRSAAYRYDKRMVRAAEIARARARAHSVRRCWAYVKSALLAAELVESRPTTAYAKQAGSELEQKFGFRRLRISDPYKAPVGAILVYGGRGAGHVEFRTKDGFVSDFQSPKPSPRPLIGVYIKPG